MWLDCQHFNSCWPCVAHSVWPYSINCHHFNEQCHRKRRPKWTQDNFFEFNNPCIPLSVTCRWKFADTHYNFISTPLDWLADCSCLTGSVTIETGKEDDSLGEGTFKIELDVHNFHHDELTLKVRNQDMIVLQGKRRNEDANNRKCSCVSREFTRSFCVPRYYDGTQATASLSADGVLTIVVPPPPALDDVERLVEIQSIAIYSDNKTKSLDADAKGSKVNKADVKEEEQEDGEN